MFRFRSNYFKLFMKLNKVKYGRNINLYGIPVIYRFTNAAIEIGDNCRINSSFLSNLIGLQQRTIIIARGSGKINIGKNVGISGATIYAWESISIGNNTLIGANSKIFDNDFHPVDPKARLTDDGTQVLKKAVNIGENVFVGCNCIILKGTQIGCNSVVGAGSIVSGQFPPNVVIAGNPARIVKQFDMAETMFKCNL
jgi:acetyltransferase-like isoleucine patch superfamily enzyme